jgi:hypothetical protein
VIEVVRVLVVGEQDHVDAAQVGGAAGGRRELAEDPAAVPLIVAGSVERGVGEEPQAAVLEEGGRAAEDADWEGHGDLLTVMKRLSVRRP